MTIALIVGNRGFFPDHLAKSGRDEMIGVLEKAGVDERKRKEEGSER